MLSATAVRRSISSRPLDVLMALSPTHAISFRSPRCLVQCRQAYVLCRDVDDERDDAQNQAERTVQEHVTSSSYKTVLSPFVSSEETEL